MKSNFLKVCACLHRHNSSPFSNIERKGLKARFRKPEEEDIVQTNKNTNDWGGADRIRGALRFSHNKFPGHQLSELN